MRDRFSIASLVIFLSVSAIENSALFAQENRNLIGVGDLQRFYNICEPEVLPAAQWVAYTVPTSDPKEDTRNPDIRMSFMDGTATLQLTFTKENEHLPSWSPNRKYLVFLSGRESGKKTDLSDGSYAQVSELV